MIAYAPQDVGLFLLPTVDSYVIPGPAVPSFPVPTGNRKDVRTLPCNPSIFVTPENIHTFEV